LQHHPGKTARQRQRINVAAGSVPETAEPGIRSQHRARLVAGQHFDRRAEFRPLPDAPLGDLDAARRMHRLHPARLFLLGLNLIASDDIEQV
jgi:hypothetical protein